MKSLLPLTGVLAGLLTSLVATTGCIHQTSVAQHTIGLTLFATGFTHPLNLQPYPGTTDLLVVDQNGTITRLDANGTKKGFFLDLRNKLVTLDPDYDERGLLGLAFHPDFIANHKVYIFYSAPLRHNATPGFSCTNYLSEFDVIHDKVNLDSERVLLYVDKPQENHNGGSITFGPDGYLYVPLGDGGGANDVGPGHLPGGNAQNLTTLLGKILRIDVNSIDPYTVPDDNPFINSFSNTRPEIYAYGLRNPYKISFDSAGNHALFAADEGQNRWEELDIITKGANYGWNIREGTHCFDPDNPDTDKPTCPTTDQYGRPFTEPILEYLNAQQPDGLGHAIIGGFVYHGNALPFLQNHFLFGDWSGTTDHAPLYHAYSNNTSLWSSEPLAITNTTDNLLPGYLLGFGEDTHHEPYVMTSTDMGPTGTSGAVYKLTSG